MLYLIVILNPPALCAGSFYIFQHGATRKK